MVAMVARRAWSHGLVLCYCMLQFVLEAYLQAVYDSTNACLASSDCPDNRKVNTIPPPTAKCFFPIWRFALACTAR